MQQSNGKVNGRRRRTMAQIIAARERHEAKSGKAMPDFAPWEVHQMMDQARETGNYRRMDDIATQTGGPAADSRCKLQSLPKLETPASKSVTGWVQRNGTEFLNDRGRHVAQTTAYRSF